MASTPDSATPQRAKFQASEFFARSWVVGSLLVLAALILFWIGAKQTYDPYQALFLAIASMVGTVGILSVIYDAFIKRTLIVDILNYVNISLRLRSIGLVDASQGSLRLAWDDYLGQLQWVRVLVVDLGSWLASAEWQIILREAAQRPVDISLLVAGDVLDSGVVVSSPTVASEAVRAGRDWNQRHKSAQLDGRSTFSIYQFDGLPPAQGIILSNRHLILQTRDALEPRLDNSGVLLCFANTTDNEIVKWATLTLDSLPGQVLLELGESTLKPRPNSAGRRNELFTNREPSSPPDAVPTPARRATTRESGSTDVN